jgi:hypothetical protein
VTGQYKSFSSSSKSLAKNDGKAKPVKNVARQINLVLNLLLFNTYQLKASAFK